MPLAIIAKGSSRKGLSGGGPLASLRRTMKSKLFARSLRLLAALGWGTASLLLAQSTNLINDGTSLDHLTALANRHGTAGATLGLTPGDGALAAAQSGAITDMALNGVWFDDRRFPDTNRFAVLADVRPETSYPETSPASPPGSTPSPAGDSSSASGPGNSRAPSNWPSWTSPPRPPTPT